MTLCMTSWPAVRSENAALGPASNRSKRKLLSGNRARFSFPNQHFDQGLNPNLWIHESSLQGSPVKERCATFGPHCAPHVCNHSCKDIKTLWDTQVDRQGSILEKYIILQIFYFLKNTVYFRMVTQVLFLFCFVFGVFSWFFCFSPEKEWK